MPGSGKSTLGKQVAAHLGVQFVDLDAEIEKTEGRSIADIFSQHGEDYFRALESRLLREWAAGSTAFVMATGGGAPCFHNGIDVINESGLSVFLDCSVQQLIERVRKNQERPLLVASDEKELKDRLERMLENRRNCYQRAAVVLRNATLDSLLKQLHLKM